MLPASQPPRRNLNPVVLVGLVAVLLLAVLGGSGYYVLRASDDASGQSAPAAVPAAPVAPVPVPAVLTDRGPRAGRLVVTPAMAQRVVEAYWPLHAQALLDNDYDRLSRLSSSSVRRWEVGGLSCGCLHVTHLRPLISATYSVPRQTAYPAHFIAFVKTAEANGQQRTEVLVLERRTQRASWRVVEDSAVWPTPTARSEFMQPSVTAKGFAEPVDRNVARHATILSRDLAAAWQETEETGRISMRTMTRFAMSAQTRERFDRIGLHTQGERASNGLISHATYWVQPSDPLVTATMATGDTLVCQPVRKTQVWTAGSGRTVYQDPGRHNWGRFLTPGNYRALRVEEVWQTCFLVSSYPGQPVVVLNQPDGGGIPAPAAART